MENKSPRTAQAVDPRKSAEVRAPVAMRPATGHPCKTGVQLVQLL